jgi:hypothetical protein
MKKFSGKFSMSKNIKEKKMDRFPYKQMMIVVKAVSQNQWMRRILMCLKNKKIFWKRFWKKKMQANKRGQCQIFGIFQKQQKEE